MAQKRENLLVTESTDGYEHICPKCKKNFHCGAKGLLVDCYAPFEVLCSKCLEIEA